MHSQICDFPSKTLYHSQLKSDPSVASHLLVDLSNAHSDSEDFRKEMLETPVVFMDTAGCEYFEKVEDDADEGSRCNENEASIVKKYVGNLVKPFPSSCDQKVSEHYQVESGVLPNQISVITPYDSRSQSWLCL
jgi:DNA polymerase alpha-associated DNA helicase A